MVDDEASIIDGLRRALRRARGEWEIHSALSGREALDKMATAQFDAIVSDMRMPGMDGAELLDVVRRSHPATARLILTGEANLSSSVRSALSAHQVLTKPCSATNLIDALNRTCALVEILSDPRMRSLTGGVGVLPAQPVVFRALTEALCGADPDPGDLAPLVEADVAITAKVLQMINSSFFGIRRTVVDVTEAIQYLGTDVLKALVLSAEAHEVFATDTKSEGLNIDALHQRSGRVAQLARRLANTDAAGSAFMAALLADIGQLVLASVCRDDFAALLVEARSSGRLLYEVEADHWGFGHAEVGAYLLGLWGLPAEVVTAVAQHHSEGGPHTQSGGVADAVRRAEAGIDDDDSEQP